MILLIIPFSDPSIDYHGAITGSCCYEVARESHGAPLPAPVVPQGGPPTPPQGGYFDLNASTTSGQPGGLGLGVGAENAHQCLQLAAGGQQWRPSGANTQQRHRQHDRAQSCDTRVAAIHLTKGRTLLVRDTAQMVYLERRTHAQDAAALDREEGWLLLDYIHWTSSGGTTRACIATYCLSLLWIQNYSYKFYTSL